MYGADVAQLRDTAAELRRSAERLTSSRTELSATLAASPWSGPDAERFRGEWQGALSRILQDAGARLAAAADALERNAADQEATSAAGGGATAGAGTASGPYGGSPDHPPAGASAQDVTRWWDSLTPAQQRELLAEHPDRLGTLDGIPAAVRDQANRAWLTHELDRLAAEEPPRTIPNTSGWGVPYGGTVSNPAWDAWHQQVATLQNVQHMLDADRSLSLLLLDTRSGPVEVALAVGDVDTADHVGVYTQGLFSNTANADGVRDAAASVTALNATARDLLLRDGRPGESSAMIMWMGYDAPQNVVDVLSDAQAKTGADRLASFADGIRATNPGTHLTGLGHSYGSLVTGLAASETTAFDSVAVFGSPGIDADGLAAVHVDDGQFYVLQNPGDPVAASGWFGTKPSDLPGAQVLSTAPSAGLSGATGPSGWLPVVGMVSPIGGLVMAGDYALGQHTDYLVEKSTSQNNLAAVVVGARDRMIR
ncbi:alpha/beta hydrolase [Microbacterium sp.]|mgnify:CR=1 FL=1|uniref:alpha/beta hydrolase n=1 Tax=Microbacterium sp. TaxID=51671 RepID=UPI00092C1B68|nr:alpha/beta hydrolase [Microbacterium sp.]MBN9192436.1 hypothetical protein [Microbacterium sp.]OJU72270.1 MAG: hypothetical protein BGO04_11950 [Microbacterium sp. 70-38]